MTEDNHGESTTDITLSAKHGGEGRGEVASILEIWPSHA